MAKDKVKEQGATMEEIEKLEVVKEIEEPTPPVAVFRSQSKLLRLVWRASYFDKSHGIPEFHPGEGVQFNDFYLRIPMISKNEKILERVRKHLSNGIAFIEVPDMSDESSKPSLKEMEGMTKDQLIAECERRRVTTMEDMTKEAIILLLLKN